MLYRKLLISLSLIVLLFHACNDALFNPFEKDTYKAKDAAKDITSFKFEKAPKNPVLSFDAIGIIGVNAVDVIVPFGTSLAVLEPTILFSGVSINPASGNAHTFLDGTGVPYIVTAADATTKTYTVTLYKPPTVGNSGALGFSGVGTNSITVNWNKAADDQTPAANLQYLVYTSTVNNIDIVANIETNGTPVGIYATDINTKTVTGLLDSKMYYFNVIVKDQNNNKTAYTMKLQATLDASPPVPGNSGTLKFGSITPNSITVNWTKASDNITPQANLQYQLYYSPTCNIDSISNIDSYGTPVGSFTADISSTTVTSLTHIKCYYFNLIVKDQNNNRSAYTMNSRLTLPGVPSLTNTIGADLTAAVFNSPFRMVIVGSYMYVTDWNNHTVSKVDMTNGNVSTFAGLSGVSGFSDGNGASARFANPAGICSDSTNLYVGENGGKVRKIVIATGDVTTIASLSYSVYGLATDGTNLYLANYGNSKIDKMIISTHAISTYAGSTTGYLDAVGTSAQFNYIQDLCTDGTYLYVSDYLNYKIRKIDLATAQVTTLVTGLANLPLGIDTDGQYVYFGMYGGNTRKVEIATQIVTNLANMSTPYDMVTDGTKLYVADDDTNSIRTIQ